MSSPNKKVLLVLGATGNQGGSVLRWFAQHQPHAFQLRGMTRDPNSTSSQSLTKLGVEMVQANNDSLESLKRAFAGATHIFANTDSNQYIFDAVQHPEKLKAGQTPTTYGQKIEEQQGRNIVEAAASTPTLERIIWSSIASPKKWSEGKYQAPMFDAKENIADMFWVHPALKEKLSVLLVGSYVLNALRLPEVYCPSKKSDGVYELRLPISGEVPTATADVEGDIGSWTAALFNAAPQTTLLGASEMMGWRELTETWGRVNNVPVRYVRSPNAEFTSKMPAIGQAFLEAFEFVEQHGLEGEIPNVLKPEDLRKQGIGIQTTPVVEAMRRVDWSGVM